MCYVFVSSHIAGIIPHNLHLYLFVDSVCLHIQGVFLFVFIDLPNVKTSSEIKSSITYIVECNALQPGNFQNNLTRVVGHAVLMGEH